jgi:predicted RNA-binding Zn-ribbon protein involved in translation (DUF1610 family)
VVGTCPECGTVRFEASNVTLIILDGIMVFDCPECGRRNDQPSALKAEEALLAAGANLILQ